MKYIFNEIDDFFDEIGVTTTSLAFNPLKTLVGALRKKMEHIFLIDYFEDHRLQILIYLAQNYLWRLYGQTKKDLLQLQRQVSDVSIHQPIRVAPKPEKLHS